MVKLPYIYCNKVIYIFISVKKKKKKKKTEMASPFVQWGAIEANNLILNPMNLSTIWLT